MSVQGDYKDKVIGVEYVSKKGKQISTAINMILGRKIRQSIIIEQKRLDEKIERREDKSNIKRLKNVNVKLVVKAIV